MTSFSSWQISNIRLENGVDALPSLKHGYGHLLVFFWWRGILLGRRVFLAGELPVPAHTVAAVASQVIAPAVRDHILGRNQAPYELIPHRVRQASLEALKRSAPVAPLASRFPLPVLSERLALPSPQALAHRISVIVCTRDRPDSLARCLRSLVPSRPYLHEVLVVDNAPASGAARRVVDEHDLVGYIAEPRPGLSRARNTGIKHSSGTIIAFTDDDVVVHNDWGARLHNAFSRSEVMCVTGQVIPLSLETPAQVAFEESLGGFSQGFRPIEFDGEFFEATKRFGVPVWRIGAGANMAFRRTAFDLVGPFDERLGAGAAGCSEDSELWYRLLADGRVCRYDPTAVVFHEHRASWSALEEQSYYYMRGHVAALLLQFMKYRHWGNLVRIFSVLPSYYAGVFVRAVSGGNLRQSLLWPRVRGSLAGLMALRQYRSECRDGTECARC